MLVRCSADLVRKEAVAAQAWVPDDPRADHQRLRAGIESVVGQGSHLEDPTKAHQVVAEDMTGFVVGHMVAAALNLLEVAAAAAARVEAATLVEEDDSDAENQARE